MADSRITKAVLAMGLKKLLEAQPFVKINVSDICAACGVSRKTFYYHFKDKYDLTQWVFQTEFIDRLTPEEAGDRWRLFSALCQYFSRERNFYRALFQYEGQNSFREFFQKYLYQALEPFVRPERTERLQTGSGGVAPEAVEDIYVHFVSDAVYVAVVRWVTEGEKLPPEQFVALLKGVVKLLVAQSIRQWLNQEAP